MGSFIALLILGGFVWFWFDSTKAKESASRSAAIACIEIGVQFLDQTVSLEKIKPSRNQKGQFSLLRIYTFDFSIRGDQRFQGRAKMLGSKLLQMQLEKPEGLIIDEDDKSTSDTHQ